MSVSKYPILGAHLSDDERYRYRLWRQWEMPGSTIKTCVFVMLNPSTADDKDDDPTIRRCVGFAKAWQCGRLEVVNLFAFRTKSPAVLKSVVDDPVGPENRRAIELAASDAEVIVCAWGAHGNYRGQDARVSEWLRPASEKTFALGFTSGGQPRHPLYAPKAISMVPMFRPQAPRQFEEAEQSGADTATAEQIPSA